MSATSQRTAALVAGISIVTMAVLAGFAYGFVLQRLIVLDNPTVTAENIKLSMTLFRLGLFSFLLVLLCDVLSAWALHVFLSRVNTHLSLLAAWLRLVYSAILGTALLNFVFVVLLLNGTSYLSVFQTNQINALVMLFSNGFFTIWSIGLVIFGCHLYVLGYLVFMSGFIPRIFGILLIVASLCYIVSNVASLLLSNYQKYKATVELVTSLPMIVGELGFGLWLLIKGGTGAQNEDHSHEKAD